ncbi:hypothetical protein BDP27DRAFT_1371178 [Rhodocollybia butyracea]|uniref:Uncharacterized protein n=1 Tax=Rhodocollybia butyracea TaxID=206335 RepID=A0A9P5TZ05_9AGAR|nr:hypothetical protein BDP27DRAFT_1371178 [Rhodocollybia butyracea]
MLKRLILTFNLLTLIFELLILIPNGAQASPWALSQQGSAKLLGARTSSQALTGLEAQKRHVLLSYQWRNLTRKQRHPPVRLKGLFTTVRELIFWPGLTSSMKIDDSLMHSSAVEMWEDTDITMFIDPGRDAVPQSHHWHIAVEQATLRPLQHSYGWQHRKLISQDHERYVPLCWLQKEKKVVKMVQGKQ